ncbi:MAG TPA: DUF3085 domain-containing protein [Rhodospirillales bacterium]|nr:DUF3085 domain-containing protein [Rhodospirillales bacterium]
MRLCFKLRQVKTLLQHAAAAPATKPVYDEHTGPGLWLVGDDGIYLMSNGLPPLLHPDQDVRHVVAYARECDPTRMDFDAWRTVKNASFGGDDGVEFLPLPDLQSAVAGSEGAGVSVVMLDVTPKAISVLRSRHRLN